MPDQPTALERAAALVALLQALCAAALEWPAPSCDPAVRGIYQQNRWAALRFGPDAGLVHPNDDRTAPARALATELVDRIRPHARDLGSEPLLDALDPAESEGSRQVEIGRALGLHAACADLVERSVPSRP